MKSKLTILVMLLLGMGTLMACSNNNDHSDDNVPGLPTAAVQAAFQSKYPSASAVEWESAGVFQEAEFNLGNTEYEAWFTKEGVWLQTDYSLPYANLPTAVTAVIDARLNYPSITWRPEDKADALLRKNYPDWYAVHLEDGESEIIIWSDADGYSVYDVIADYTGNEIPRTITNFITQTHPGSYIIELQQVANGTFRANILHGSEAKVMYFDRTLGWLYTSWPVLLADVPVVVTVVLDAPAYENFTVRSVSYQQYLSGDRYHFILQQKDNAGPDITLDVDPSGSIILG